jgi:glycosyltransferase involved in cell wall biosynthesis
MLKQMAVKRPKIIDTSQKVLRNFPWDEDVYTPNSSIIDNFPDLVPLVNKLKEEFPIISKTIEYKEVFNKENPLVSIVTTTYNNSYDLINTSLKSILNQTYKNLQIIVIADHSTDNTDLEMSKIHDTRIIYQNLSIRSNYPGKTKRHVWLTAGTIPMNLGISLAKGDFTTFCDQDDSFVVDRIEKLLSYAKEKKSDFIHHPFYIGTLGNIKQKYNSPSLSLGNVTTSAIFHHKFFNQISWDINCWKIDEPGDWNRFKKFIEIGAKIDRHSEFLTYKG